MDRDRVFVITVPCKPLFARRPTAKLATGRRLIPVDCAAKLATSAESSKTSQGLPPSAIGPLETCRLSRHHRRLRNPKTDDFEVGILLRPRRRVRNSRQIRPLCIPWPRLNCIPARFLRRAGFVGRSPTPGHRFLTRRAPPKISRSRRTSIGCLQSTHNRRIHIPCFGKILLIRFL